MRKHSLLKIMFDWTEPLILTYYEILNIIENDGVFKKQSVLVGWIHLNCIQNVKNMLEISIMRSQFHWTYFSKQKGSVLRKKVYFWITYIEDIKHFRNSTETNIIAIVNLSNLIYSFDEDLAVFALFNQQEIGNALYVYWWVLAKGDHHKFFLFYIFDRNFEIFFHYLKYIGKIYIQLFLLHKTIYVKRNECPLKLIFKFRTLQVLFKKIQVPYFICNLMNNFILVRLLHFLSCQRFVQVLLSYFCCVDFLICVFELQKINKRFQSVDWNRCQFNISFLG